MLGAEHAHRAVVAPQRHVQHGADVIRDEVGVEEFAGARIGPGVAGGDDAFPLERGEIVGRIVPVQSGSRFVAVAARVIQARAADDGARVVEAPHAQPFDAQRARRDLEDAPQPLVESLAGIGIAGGERRQGVALLDQPALAGLERRFGGELLADVVEDGEDGGLGVPRDEPERGEDPERIAVRPLDLQPKAVRSAVAPQPVGQQDPLRGVDVVVADRHSDGVVRPDAEELRRARVDREHGVILKPADDRRERTHVEQLRVEVVRRVLLRRVHDVSVSWVPIWRTVPVR